MAQVLQYEKDPKTVLPDVAAELCTLRKEAVEGRAATKIEERWQYAEDAYAGEDEVTKGRTAGYHKPTSLNGPFLSTNEATHTRSTAIPNITMPYCDAASARVADMLFPADERNWEIRPTPKADVDKRLQQMKALPQEAIPLAMQAVQASVDATFEGVQKAQEQIDDWLSETEFNSVGRTCVEDACRVGSGVIKGPIPMDVKGRIQPGSKIVKVQNLFPDPNCGTDIHAGNYIFELEPDVSARTLRAKEFMPDAGWLPESIKKCLEEGPRTYDGRALSDTGKPIRAYELWHFQGEVSVDALMECGCHPQDDGVEKMWAQVTLCNDYIVRMSVAPLQNIFTYVLMRWQKRSDHWAGIGVAEQLETVQRGLTAAVRAMFDNAAMASGPQLVYWKDKIVPVGGQFVIRPWGLWEVVDEELSVSDVQNAITTIEIPMLQEPLNNIISLMRDMAQEVTGIPLIIMGQSSTGAVGSDQLQTNAGTTVLRRLAKYFDSDVTVPHIDAYYEYYKWDTEEPVAEAVIDARGSSVLVERDIQAQAIINVVQMSANPIYGVDPELAMREWLQSLKFDPRKVVLTQERKEELLQQLNAPDEKAQATVESAKLRTEAIVQGAAIEAETDRAEIAMRNAAAERDRVHDKEMLELKYRFELVSYAMQKGIDVSAAAAEVEKAARGKSE